MHAGGPEGPGGVMSPLRLKEEEDLVAVWLKSPALAGLPAVTCEKPGGRLETTFRSARAPPRAH